MTSVSHLVSISLLVVVFNSEVSCFPAFSRVGEDVFPGANEQESIPERLQTTYGEKRTIKKHNLKTDKDLPFPPSWPWSTPGEKRTFVNNKHEWGLDKGFPQFPERPPWSWPTNGEKRSAVNNKHFWPIDKDHHFPNFPPWTNDGEKRSAINLKERMERKAVPDSLPPELVYLLGKMIED